MKVPSISLLRAYSPWFSPVSKPLAAGCLRVQRPDAQQRASFSSTEQRQKRDKSMRPKRDYKVVMIRYALHHPKTPRPLRFSRLRYLRHWTIHRAWQMFQDKQRTKRTTELYQQYQCMANACELLRNIDQEGLTAQERSDLGIQSATEGNVGRLFRTAMMKTDMWNKVPIEYARLQTDTPPTNGWDHSWTR